MDKINLGEFIKKRRKQLNISLNDLSDNLDISFQAVHKWEKGESYPDFIILGDLCNVLKISIDDLLSLSFTKDYVSSNSFNYETFGLTVKKYQKDLGLSQKSLAKLTNINQSTISNIINQKSYPTIEQFICLCNTFKISYSTLYYSSFISSKKEEKPKIKIPLKLLFTLGFAVLTSILVICLFPEKTPTYNQTHVFIEYWDDEENLIESKTIKLGDSITNPPSCPTSSGWNKDITTPTSSTIIKANPEKYNIKLFIYDNINNRSYTYYYDTLDEYNEFDVSSATHYCTELKYETNELFDIYNLPSKNVTLYGNFLPKSTHSVFFPSEFNLDSITIKDAEKINFMPVVSTENFIIKDWEYNGIILDPKKPYSFESTINVNPIYINQQTKIDSNGYITSLHSKDKLIVIPDEINKIKVKGIKANSITLDSNNEEIIFLNTSPISFKNVFNNPSLINTIKNITINYDSFTYDSYLGPITSLDTLYVNSGDQNINPYPLIKLSSKPFHINNIKYYYKAHAIALFNDLDVDNVYCLDKGFTHVVENMFENSTIKNFYYSKSLNDFSIHDSAFKNCNNLTSFTFHKKTKLYGNNQFYDCKNLKTVKFLGTINTLSNNMFYNTKIESLTINNPVETVCNLAFNGTNLYSIELFNVENIEDDIYIPTTLKNLYIGGLHGPLNITKKDLTIHYLDYNLNYYNAFNSKKHNVCLNCLCLHKGEYE